MAFQSVPNCAEAVIEATLGGKPIFNVLNFFILGGYEQADINALGAAVDQAVGDSWLPIWPTNLDYVQTHVRGLMNSIDLENVSTSNAGPGTGTGTALANNVAFCVTFRTGLTGRSARGRMYVGGIRAGYQATPTTFTSGIATDWVAAIGDVHAAAVLQGWTPVVVSRISGGIKRAEGIFNPIVSIDARNLDIDSQRGRLLADH